MEPPEDALGRWIIVESLPMIVEQPKDACFERAEKPNVQRLQETACIRRYDDDNDVAVPAGLEELDFNVRIVAVEEQQSAAAPSDTIACKRVKDVLEPLLHEEAVDPPGVTRHGALWYVLPMSCEPNIVQVLSWIDNQRWDGGVMSDTPILSLYSWDPSIGCYAADH